MSPCCALCRTPSGVCASNWSCQHHLDAEAQEEANHRARSSRRDPTADEAIRNLTRNPKRPRR
jgi:hypothetical protein